MPPFFAGLLPEGRRLSNLRRAIKTSAYDQLSLLLAVGRDCVGDVQVVPHGEVPAPTDALGTVERSFNEVRFADHLADAAVIDPVAIPGVQDKVSARVISVLVARAADRYILKFDPPEYPHVVLNETYFLDVARKARLPVADADVVHDADGRPGLLVRRFDRAAEPGGSSVSLACEDACQLLDRWPGDKYNVTSEALVAAVSNVCASASLAKRDVFRQLCFAWLTGNGDVHAKNISVLADENGEWRVAPAYDLPSTVLYNDRTLALPLGGRTKGLSRQLLLGFASSVGLPEKAAKSGTRWHARRNRDGHRRPSQWRPSLQSADPQDSSQRTQVPTQTAVLLRPVAWSLSQVARFSTAMGVRRETTPSTTCESVIVKCRSRGGRSVALIASPGIGAIPASCPAKETSPFSPPLPRYTRVGVLLQVARMC